MQLKTTLRLHLTPVKMAKIKGNNHKCSWRRGERGTLTHCWWECQLVQSHWKAVWRFLKKIEIELPFHPVIHSWVSTQNKVWQDTVKTSVCQCLSQHYSQKPSSENNSDAPQLTNGS
jgi:hypothetical protein